MSYLAKICWVDGMNVSMFQAVYGHLVCDIGDVLSG